ncbi:hypothetical protein DTL42_17450 [Bremerella cremea]|uniref:Uncharacterized protein n=1 Tax=Bremerella cremea TaxID=1031537 RepID=A0A368KNB0_9BACT|nr:hypothetical protein [Bremerella cremea]RCS44705.1 hypothetical protein DTL42_17450 [Bremerella cremea]
MVLFLKIVAGFFIAFLLLVVFVYYFIRWKFGNWIKKFADAMKEAFAGGVPPFRIHLRKREPSEEEDEDDWVPRENREAFEEYCAEFESLGFIKLEDYFIDEIAAQMRVFVDESTRTYGVVYSHPMLNVWCDIVRKFEDGTGWTFGLVKYHGMDSPPHSTHKFFPDESLADMVAKFQQEAPREGAILVSKEDFPAFFEKEYAAEMDWRIERCGPTEQEVRRIADLDGQECTDQMVQQTQMQWRLAIAEFQKERVLKRYRKEAELDSFQWDYLQNYGVVVHHKMTAEELLNLYDEDYFPVHHMEIEEEDLDDEDIAQQTAWEKRLGELRTALGKGSPQEVFRNMIELGNGSATHKWEFKKSVSDPVVADIWTRTYQDEENQNWDDED